jgi:hypothetical protein
MNKIHTRLNFLLLHKISSLLLDFASTKFQYLNLGSIATLTKPIIGLPIFLQFREIYVFLNIFRRLLSYIVIWVLTIFGSNGCDFKINE